MIEPDRIRARFFRSLPTYDAAATVQRHMARRLCELLPGREYGHILEVGCGTGLCTQALASRLSCTRYTANDIVPECAAYIHRILPNAAFIAGNIDTLTLTPEHTLIISNACLQWSTQLPTTLTKLLESLLPGGILACSLFGKKNFQEIRALFGTGLPYPDLAQLRGHVAPHRVLALEEEQLELRFPSLLAVLRHMRATGVNAFPGMALGGSGLRHMEQRYRERFGLCLTYHPLYLVVQKN